MCAHGVRRKFRPPPTCVSGPSTMPRIGTARGQVGTAFARLGRCGIGNRRTAHYRAGRSRAGLGPRCTGGSRAKPPVPGGRIPDLASGPGSSSGASVLGLAAASARGVELGRTARTAREAGVKWSREDFTWARIEPERGRFDWSFYDSLVATAIRNGISVYAIAGYWTTWTKPYTEQGMNDYVAYLRQLVRRYKRDTHQWEILERAEH